MQLKLDTLFEKGELKMDYYKILGVTEQADEKEIKQAYRRLARKYHPDLNPDNPEAEARFKSVVEAYETLGDAEKRKKYDLKRKRTGSQDRSQKKSTARAADININFGKRNPLDVTEMFEAFMKMK